MTNLPTSRGPCRVCRRVMAMRLDGLLRLHLNTAGAPCDGSHQPPDMRGRECDGCGDAWSETRTAAAVDTVRWPGWLA